MFSLLNVVSRTGTPAWHASLTEATPFSPARIAHSRLRPPRVSGKRCLTNVERNNSERRCVRVKPDHNNYNKVQSVIIGAAVLEGPNAHPSAFSCACRPALGDETAASITFPLPVRVPFSRRFPWRRDNGRAPLAPVSRRLARAFAGSAKVELPD